MSKTFDIEVSTEMSIIEPQGFTASLATVGAQVFDKPRQSGIYIPDDMGVGVRPKDQHFRVVKEDKIRYVHFDRAIEPFGTIGFKFYQLLAQIDPDMRDESVIGGIDLKCEISKELNQRIGEYSAEGYEYSFGDIDDVASGRDPNRRIFVIRNVEDEKTTEIRTVDPLRVVTEFVRSRIKELNPDIYHTGSEDLHNLENGLIVGSTSDLNPDRIETFKQRFRTTFLKDDPIIARVGSLGVLAGIA